MMVIMNGGTDMTTLLIVKLIVEKKSKTKNKKQTVTVKMKQLGVTRLRF